MPDASVGAPPVRDAIVCSPTLAAAWLMWSGVAGEPVKPSPLTYLAVAALSWVCRTAR